jgi:hypothetical protein
MTAPRNETCGCGDRNCPDCRADRMARGARIWERVKDAPRDYQGCANEPAFAPLASAPVRAEEPTCVICGAPARHSTGGLFKNIAGEWICCGPHIPAAVEEPTPNRIFCNACGYDGEDRYHPTPDGCPVPPVAPPAAGEAESSATLDEDDGTEGAHTASRVADADATVRNPRTVGEDAEPLSAEAQASLDAGLADLRAGRTVSLGSFAQYADGREDADLTALAEAVIKAQKAADVAELHESDDVYCAAATALRLAREAFRNEATPECILALLAARDEARADTKRLDALQRLIQICDRVELFDTSLSGRTVILAAGDVAGSGDFVREALDQCIADFRTSDELLRAALPTERGAL